ncbi:MAG: toxin-activating lysine-acyltransferase [Hyphomicrobiaceae bacterium]|nr:toxin-activating lysine-acyltransferase [Hyphomicrobiaceae bacterium]
MFSMTDPAAKPVPPTAEPRAQPPRETPPPAMPPELAGALASKIISASLGDAVMVFARSPAHRHFSFADIEWKLLPPLLSAQIYIAEAQHKERGFRVPVALVTWARVSDEVDARLTTSAGAPVRLRPDEWTSGEHIWIVDLVGDTRGLNLALGTLSQGPFKDRTVKVVTRDKAGAARVETLAELAAAGQEGRPAFPAQQRSRPPQAAACGGVSHD